MKRSDLRLYALGTSAVFIVLLCAGIAMRLNQADRLDLGPLRFYALMTLHGLGMVGTLSVAATGGLFWLLRDYVPIGARIVRVVFGCYLVAVVCLLAATVPGDFAPGWYMLYPLPFQSMGTWPGWSTGLALGALMVLGTALLLAQCAMLDAIVRKYGLAGAVGWQYFRARPGLETPAPVLIAVCAYLLPGVATSLVGTVLMMMYLAQWLQPAMHFDPLLMKNLMMLWGHTMANISLYVGVAFVYQLLPKYSGRAWKTNRAVVLAWNAVFLFVLFAFFHHLYQDFVEPFGLAVIGQIASYASAVPSTAVTVTGMVAQIYKSGMKWRFAPLAVVLGIVGWVAGGFAAVIDSTILVNNVLHNTLFVPAHFHTYYLLGLLPMVVGFYYESLECTAEDLGMWGLSLLCVGSFGFLSMFYVAGALQVPRRYSDYNAIPLAGIRAVGQDGALLGALFAALILLGILLFVAAFSVRRASTGESGSGTPHPAPAATGAPPR